MLHCTISDRKQFLQNWSSIFKEIEMTHTATQFMASNQASVKALQAITKNSAQGFETLLKMNLAVTQAFIGQFQGAMSAQNAQSLRELQSELFTPFPSKYSAERQHYKLLAEDTNAKFTKLVQSTLSEAQKGMSILA